MEPCLCGYKPTSRSTGKRHRKACPIWNNTDKELERKKSFEKTMTEKYGVTNPMQLESVKEKLKDTCQEKYGSNSVFGSNSSVFEKVQLLNRVKKSESAYWSLRKRKSNRFKPVDFEFVEVEFSILEKKDYGTAVSLLDEFHYAKSGRGAKIIFILKLKGVIIAVAKYSSVVRKETATSLGYDHIDVLELDRFCIHPKYQKKNLGSFFLSKTIKYIKSNTQTKLLISFADSGQNHDGALYKASGWRYVGDTKDSYEYVDKEMNPINKKTVYNRAVKEKMKESEYVKKLGLIKIITPPKRKFILELRQ